MNKKIKESLGIVLVVAGIFILIVQPFSPTGAVIDLSTSKAKVSFFVGLGMIIVGIVLALAGRSGRKDEGGLGTAVDDGPSSLRVQRKHPGDTYAIYVTQPRHKMSSTEKYFHARVVELSSTGKEEWISQGEVDGLKKEFKKAGFRVRGPEMDIGGPRGPDIRHLKIKGYSDANRHIKKHLFITTDPKDERLLKKSDVYRTDHPIDYEE